jgi:hypothetical protein
VKRAWLVVGVGACVLATGCGGSSSVGLPQSSTSAHQVSVPSGSLRAATLDVSSGVTDLAVSVGAASGRLATVSTPPTSGQRPALALTHGGVADLQLVSVGTQGGPSVVDVRLDPGVVWTIELDGGAGVETVDLRGGRVALVDLAAGVTRATIDLPAASGTQTVHEAGGASELTVVVPAAAAAAVHVSGGASTVRIGTRTHSGVGGNQTFTDPGYASASDRVDLELQGGVSSVDVRRS